MAIKTEVIKKPTVKHGLKGAALFYETRIDKPKSVVRKYRKLWSSL